MTYRVARIARIRADLDRLMSEADDLGLVDVAIDLDHARSALDGWSGACPAQKSFALMLANAWADSR